MRIRTATLLSLVAAMVLSAPSVFACGGDEVDSLHVHIPVTGLSADNQAAVKAGLEKSFETKACDKPCCKAKPAKPVFSVDAENGAVDIELPKRVTLNWQKIAAVFNELKLQADDNIALSNHVQLELDGVTCGGCAGAVKSQLGGIDGVEKVVTKVVGEGKGMVLLAMAEGKSVSLSAVKGALGKKFSVQDVIWDARCGTCTGFADKAKKPACGGCAEE